MLLVDKVANRIVRQSAADVQNSLAVALSLIQHYPPGLQIEVRISVGFSMIGLVDNISPGVG